MDYSPDRHRYYWIRLILFPTEIHIICIFKDHRSLTTPLWIIGHTNNSYHNNQMSDRIPPKSGLNVSSISWWAHICLQFIAKCGELLSFVRGQIKCKMSEPLLENGWTGGRRGLLANMRIKAKTHPRSVWKGHLTSLSACQRNLEDDNMTFYMKTSREKNTQSLCLCIVYLYSMCLL